MATTRRSMDEPEDQVPDPREAELASMRAEIQGLTVLVRNVLAERIDAVSAAPAPPPPLEPLGSERERITRAWAAEPRVQIYISPDENELRAAASLQARGAEAVYPPRVFQVNGVQLAIDVGEQISVPESIAALYAYTLNPWKSQHKVKPVTFDVIEARMG